MGTYRRIELGAALYQHADWLYPGFTTNGNHTTNSWHFRNGGCAVDFDSGTNGATAHALGAVGVSRWTALSGMATYLELSYMELAELFSTDKGHASGHYVKNGVKRSYTWALIRGLATFSESVDHIHVAIATDFAADAFVTRCVQMALGLPPTGNRSSSTIAAIKAVQAAAKIAVDGDPGPNTVRAIRAHKHWAPVPWTFK